MFTLHYSLHGRIIFWSERLSGRYQDTPFSRDLRIDLAVRLAERQFVHFSRIAPECDWNLHSGQVEPGEGADLAALLDQAEAAAWADLAALEVAAAMAVQRLLPAETQLCEPETSACRCFTIANLLRLTYAPDHDNDTDG